MKYNSNRHHRRSVRLRGYDYSQNGAYFITICAYHREYLFGEIVDQKMVLSEIGVVVQHEWLKTSVMRKNIELDEFVIMPNHLHAIIIINDEVQCRGTMHRAPTVEQFAKPTLNSVPTIIRGYKAAVTSRVNEMHNTLGVPVWQRNYYEHVIRNEGSLHKIREYIVNNPINWQQDEMNLGL